MCTTLYFNLDLFRSRLFAIVLFRPRRRYPTLGRGSARTERISVGYRGIAYRGRVFGERRCAPDHDLAVVESGAALAREGALSDDS